MIVEKENIVRMYKDYVRAFQTLEASAVLPFYHVPFMSVSSREVRVLASPAEIENSFARNMEYLKKRNYTRTEIIDLDVRQMSQDLALVGVGLERYTADGEQLQPGTIYAYTYTLRKVDDHWKIVVAMAHDPETIVRTA